jgi:predicted dehydrogenase
MKAIILGCGLISGRWIRTLAADPRITITALIDTDQQAAAQAADSCGLADVPWFPVMDAALAADSVDIAVNLTPAGSHARYTRSALEHGLHVFTEKPLARGLDEAWALTQLAQSRGLTLTAMSNRGQDARFLAFAGLVRGLGSGPCTVSEDMFVRLPIAGFRSQLRFPALQDLAVHAFDQIRQVISVAPAEVTSGEVPLPLPGGHCSIASATVTFTDRSVFTFRGGFTGPGHQTSADGHWRIDLPGAGCRWDGQHNVTILHDTPGQPPATRSLPPPDGHGPRITAMIDAVHGGPPLPDTLGSIALLDAALQSALTGRPAAVQQTRL